jgi:hypothetical protein
MSRPLVILVVTRNVFHGPRFFNVPKILANYGFKVIIFGYNDDKLPINESIEKCAKIFRIDLKSRKIKFAPLRKFFSFVEFFIVTSKIVKKTNPCCLITFSDPAAILLKFAAYYQNKILKINWILEIPEFNSTGFFEGLLLKISILCWQSADILVTPTKERMALSLSLQPSCITKSHFVIHNSPLMSQYINKKFSNKCQFAINLLVEVKAKGLISLIYTGAIGNSQAIGSLIKAVGNIKSGISLLLLGKKNNLSSREVTTALNVVAYPENIFWIDEIPYRELQEVLPYADVGFVTYRGDTLNTLFSAPGKIYEYLKAGLLILSDKNCCISDEILMYDCGILFPRPITDIGVRQAVEKIMQNKSEIERRKLASKELFKDRFSFEQQVMPVVEKIIFFA